MHRYNNERERQKLSIKKDDKLVLGMHSPNRDEPHSYQKSHRFFSLYFSLYKQQWLTEMTTGTQEHRREIEEGCLPVQT